MTRQPVFYVGPGEGDARWRWDVLPAWSDDAGGCYGIPCVDDRGFKIGIDRVGPRFDPSNGERITDPDDLRLARAFLRRRFPELAQRPVLETRVCQYESTPDRHFLIDRHPAWENVWLVGGGSGHGFKHGPRIGEYVVGRLDGLPMGGQDGATRSASGWLRGWRRAVRTSPPTPSWSPGRCSESVRPVGCPLEATPRHRSTPARSAAGRYPGNSMIKRPSTTVTG